MHEQLEEYLGALDRDACYRVDAVLKAAPHETTERVFFVGANGAEQGPFIRKRLDADSGLGSAYWRLWEAQRAGRRFVHVPRLVECYSTGDTFVVVMECVAGETLADAVWRADPSVELAARVFGPVCDAVSELHEQFDPPMIHRDLKPSNIMLNQAGATVIDFGIARDYDREALVDTHQFGTRSYAPPEQFGYGQTDVRSDVYALGLILYYCLTEKTPDAATVRAGFPDAAVPAALRPVLVRATAFDPAARYATVRSLRDAAAQALAAAMQEPCQQPDASTCREAHRSTLPLARCSIPGWLGITWNILLGLTWLLFMAVVTAMVLEPAPSLADYAPWGCWVMAYGTIGLGLGTVAFALSDKRPLAARFPVLARQNPVLRFAVLLAAAFIAVMLSAIVAQLSM